jgi:hypothetical protein
MADDPVAWSEEVRWIVETIFGPQWHLTLKGEYPDSTLHLTGPAHPAAFRLWGDVGVGEGLEEISPPWGDPTGVALELRSTTQKASSTNAARFRDAPFEAEAAAATPRAGRLALG